MLSSSSAASAASAALASRPAGCGPGCGPGAATAVRVMIVDDSAVVRGAVGRLLDADPDVTVVTTAANGRQALTALGQHVVDVIVLDIDMPEMDGLTALPLIRTRYPHTRVLMLSTRGSAGADVTVRALALGAADYVCKSTIRPGTQSGGSRVTVIDAYAAELCAKVRLLGRAAQRARLAVGRAATSPAMPAARGTAPNATPNAAPNVGPNIAPNAMARVASRDGGAPAIPLAIPLAPRLPVVAASVIAIASSTGGPQALAEVLGGLPASLTLPILITQHMPPEFTRLLAERLTASSHRPCAEAVDGETPLPGHVYIAPGDTHLLVVRDGRDVRLRLTKEPPVHHCRPAADPMFRSIAEAYGPGTLAVVLTGMGADGRDGAAEIVRRGGRVLAQDEASSVVWGMPGAVAHAGLATAVVPLGHMAFEVARRAVPRDASATCEAPSGCATHPPTGARPAAR